MKYVLLGVFTIYQKTLSPDHGWFSSLHAYGFCRYYPSCSEYAYQAIDRFGVLKGVCLGLKRVVRCAPWSAASVDVVPSK